MSVPDDVSRARDRTPFLKAGLSEREARHRHRLLMIIGVLMVFAASPVLVHHLSGVVGALLDGRDHLWIVCLVALHQLLEPVHNLFHVLLFLGITYALFDRVRAWRSLHRALGPIETRPVQPASLIANAAKQAGVATTNVAIVDGLPLPAFTTGFMRPRIFINAQLAEQLSEPELVAVLAHEHAHVLRRDPARLTLLRALGCLFFWIPALRRLADDVADDAEVLADDFAARDNPAALASAILALAQWRAPGIARASSLQHGGSLVGFQRDALLDRRIHRLLGNESGIATHITRPALLGAVVGLALAWTSGLAVAHPMAAHSAHCVHQRIAAYQHLFCLTGHDQTGTDDCPHDGDPTLSTRR